MQNAIDWSIFSTVLGNKVKLRNDFPIKDLFGYSSRKSILHDFYLKDDYINIFIANATENHKRSIFYLRELQILLSCEHFSDFNYVQYLSNPDPHEVWINMMRKICFPSFNLVLPHAHYSFNQEKAHFWNTLSRSSWSGICFLLVHVCHSHFMESFWKNITEQASNSKN